jgi:hypothetical protein
MPLVSEVRNIVVRNMFRYSHKKSREILPCADRCINVPLLQKIIILKYHSFDSLLIDYL